MKYDSCLLSSYSNDSEYIALNRKPFNIKLFGWDSLSNPAEELLDRLPETKGCVITRCTSPYSFQT